ncbi:GNAT family N-acetyltransferase [Cumulibacter manganitolerans]|uniref:GNAT family N-acetyltransferase n=1 Tax=Cumulibacter manganitolerans TaxID=1884992 RepID=UPI0018861A00|nr:GNAT family N-acetyltransferase [Cumulibacter manganitolerans]
MTHPRRTPPHLATPTLERVAPDGHAEFYATVTANFMEADAAGREQLDREQFGTARKLGFRVDGRWVATFDSVHRTMAVPGGQLDVAAITAVTVAGSYRRRGLLTQMMRTALLECPEPAALLWASEPSIYGRFGFGEATTRLRVTGRAPEMAFLPEIDLGTGSVDVLPAAEWLALVAPLRERLRAQRPGWLDRDEGWWRWSCSDPAEWRDGALPLQHAAHFDAAGTVTGYALYSTHAVQQPHGPDGEVRIRELVAADSASYARLWRYLVDLDLMRRIRYPRGERDLPLRDMLASTSSITCEIADATYLRIIDLPTVLGARQYAADCDVAVSIGDPLIEANRGTWRIRVAERRAEVAPTTAPADLSLGIRELSAAYLGGVRLGQLQRAGRVTEHTEGAVGALSEALGWHRMPHCLDDF